MEGVGGNLTFEGSRQTGTASDALYKELRHACAGPLVTLPRAGERAYYFPEGHMEQLKASTHQGFDQQLPSFNLPGKILCKVMYVQLQADPETDEVYAHIILLPETNPTKVISPDSPLPEPQKCNVHSFCKTLSPSDTRTHGGFSIFRRHADDCLPPQESPYPLLSLLLVLGVDLELLFRICPSNRPGQTKHHLLTTSWSDFVSAQRLVAGDVFIFLRTSRSEFVVSVNRYLEARSHELSVGMRFKMRFESEEDPERRFSGTIVGMGESPSPSSRWPDSEWRSLKVQWDEPSSILRPERVSPWELEPLLAETPPSSQPQQVSAVNVN